MKDIYDFPMKLPELLEDGNKPVLHAYLDALHEHFGYVDSLICRYLWLHRYSYVGLCEKAGYAPANRKPLDDQFIESCLTLKLYEPKDRIKRRDTVTEQYYADLGFPGVFAVTVRDGGHGHQLVFPTVRRAIKPNTARLTPKAVLAQIRWHAARCPDCPRELAGTLDHLPDTLDKAASSGFCYIERDTLDVRKEWYHVNKKVEDQLLDQKGLLKWAHENITTDWEI